MTNMNPTVLGERGERIMENIGTVLLAALIVVVGVAMMATNLS